MKTMHLKICVSLALVCSSLLLPTRIAYGQTSNSLNDVSGLSTRNRVDFDSEVIPILSHRGCNAASCHGAAAGRGGFKLSLFGSRPEADHRAIVRELRGRRVNLAFPEESLIIRKPIGDLEHEGGVLFSSDEPAAELIRRWIEQGARRERLRTLQSIEVKYSHEPIRQLPAIRKLTVIAKFESGEQLDVTSTSIVTPLDTLAVQVTANGQVELATQGEHHIVIRFLDQEELVTFVAPYLNESDLQSRLSRFNWVDDAINEKLVRLNIPVSPIADEYTLFRRVAFASCWTTTYHRRISMVFLVD